MYAIALSVGACRRAGTRVDVAWVVGPDPFGGQDRTDALAITPGGGRVGSLLGGAIDDQLVEQAGRRLSRGRLLTVGVQHVEALAAGLTPGGDPRAGAGRGPAGGEVRCMLAPADTLPDRLWGLLSDREPVCLVACLDGDEVVDTTLFTAETIGDADDEAAELFSRRASDAVVAGDRVITVLWPVPRLVVVGGGPMVEALVPAAGLLGWQVQVTADAGTATGLIAGLAPLDKVVVSGHDVDLAGAALAAALDTDVGYIGALGSRKALEREADWLAMRGITDLTRIDGPAGLDIGASAPAEVAVAILAAAIAAAGSDDS